MVWRKTWPGYLIWAVYSAFNVLLVVMFSYFSGLFPSENRMAFTAAFTALSLAGVGVIAFMGGKLADHIGEKNLGRYFWIRAGYVIAAVSMFCIAAGVRIYMLEEMHWQVSGNVSLYQTAMIGSGLIPQSDILTFIYTSVLRQILLFTGNTQAAAAVYQMLLQLLTAFVLYLIVHFSMGKIPALLTGLYALFMPFYTDHTGVLDTTTLFDLLFMTELLLVVLFLKGIGQGRYSGRWWNVWYLAAGAGIGFMLYLDAGTVVVFGLLLSAFFVENGTFRNTFRHILVLLAGMVTVFLLMTGQQAGWQRLQETFLTWVRVYFENVNTIDLFSIYSQYRLIDLITAIVMFLGCMGFIREKKRERIVPWMLMLLLLTVCTPFMGPTMLGGQQMVTLFYAVVTGGGIAAMITPVKNEKYGDLFEDEEIKDTTEAEEVKEMTEMEDNEQEQPAEKTEVPQTAPVRYVPEGMVLPMGEEDVDEDAAPRMKMPEYREAEPISLNRPAKAVAEQTDSDVRQEVQLQHSVPEKQDFDLPMKPDDDFDV